MTAPTSLRSNDQFGFTLVELLVALVISGILVAAVFQVLGSQARFSEMQSGREEVQQNARASVELISSELRSMPANAFSIEDEGRRISFHLPVAWGVLCQEQGGWARTLWGDLPADVLSTREMLGFQLEAGAVDSVTLSGNESRDDLGSCADLFTPESVPTNGFRVRRLQGSGFVEHDNVPGTPIYLYRRIVYSVGTSAGVPGIWLRRNGEPLAGPLHGGEEGFKIEPVTGGGGLRLSVAMQSRHQGSVQQVDSASTTIYFRHAGGAP